MSLLGSEGRRETGIWNPRMEEARRKRPLASADPGMGNRKAIVLPYLVREASVPLTAQYTNFTVNQVLVAKTLLREENKIPLETSSNSRSMGRYEAFRDRKDSSFIIRGMLKLGKQLVEKNVLTADTVHWEAMMQEYRSSENQLHLPQGFMERLILEGFLVSQVLGRTKLEAALRREIIRGGMADRFDQGFNFLTQVAEKVKQTSDDLKVK